MDEIFNPGCEYDDVSTITTKTFLCKNSSFQRGQDKYTIELPAQETWIDFSKSFLSIKFSVRKLNDEGSLVALTDDESKTISIINSIGKTLVKSLDVSCQNQTLVRHSLLDYRSYIHLALTENDTSLEWAQCSLTFMDKHGQFDTLNNGNTGWDRRSSYINKSKMVHTIAKLECFPFNLNHPLPPGIDFNFDFYRNTDAFCILGETQSTTADGQTKTIIPQLVIEGFSLKVDCVKPNSLAREQAFKAFSNKNYAKYPFPQVLLEHYPIAGGQQEYRIDFNRNRAVQPSLIIFGLVSESCFFGDKKLNPFAFRHFDITNIQVKVGNINVYEDGLECDFRKGDYLEPYFMLMKELGFLDSQSGLTINRNTYDQDYTLFAANIANCIDGEEKSITNEKGDANQINIILKFKEDVGQNLRLIIYGIYENMCTIGLFDESGQRNSRKIVKLKHLL